MSGLIAKKVGMSRVFLENGEMVPVTFLKVEPNVIVRLKTQEKDGYNAVVLGMGARTWKTRKGRELTRFKATKEWRVDSLDGLTPGGQITVELLPKDALVTVVGISKGRGFQGVVKRHHFTRGPQSHGSHHNREPGSIGMREEPGRVLKGKRLPGHMGKDQITLKHRAVMMSDAGNHLVAIKGPVPGPAGSTVFLTREASAA